MRAAQLAALALSVMLCILGDLSGTVQAAGVRTSAPWWFADSYRTTAFIAVPNSTAAIDTWGSGSVRLPYAPAELAMDPAEGYALVATQSGVGAYLWDGGAVLAVKHWALQRASTTGVAFLDGGGAFAVSSKTELAVYGMALASGGYHAERVQSVLAQGVIGLAAGPTSMPGSILAATGSSVQLWVSDGSTLQMSQRGPGKLPHNLGVASSSNGSIAITWQRYAIQVWAWDGARYQAIPAWDPPVPLSGVVGVSLFPRGEGYFVLSDGGGLHAYAFGPSGPASLIGYAAQLPRGAMAIGAGWSGVSMAALYPTGWIYVNWKADAGFGINMARSLDGQDWAVYQPVAVLQSIPLPVGHVLSMLRVEDGDCARGQRGSACTHIARRPLGTAIQYFLSTGSCTRWIAVAPFANVAVPPSATVCYRLLLSTDNRRRTPVVDVTDLYEIATEALQGPGVVRALLCLHSGCFSAKTASA